MVMEAVPSPQCVGREFVRQYYTLLNKAPLHLHRFYNHDSSFVHGGLKERLPEEVHGQQQIHQKIMELDFHDCKAKILLVDSHRTLENGVVVQVSGELSNKGQPMRRFVQTFVLAPQSAKKYYVRNDIFRYQDDAFSDDEDGLEERPMENETEVIQPSHAAPEHNHVQIAVAPIPTAAPVELSTGAGHPPGMNGSGVHHHRREEETRSTPATNYAAPSVQQQQPEPTPKAAPKVPTPQPAPPVEEKIEEFVEPLTEPEPAAPVEPTPPPPTKRAPVEHVAPAPHAPPEPKTFANLFKNQNPGAYNGTTTGVPSTVPPFGPSKTTNASASTITPQATNESTTGTTSTAVNGNDNNFPAAVPSQSQQQRTYNNRNNRAAVTGNGYNNRRTGDGPSGPGSYHNKDRDNDRGDKNERWAENRAPSRDSAEEIGEWKQPNGGGGGEGGYKDREFRRFDDNLQVFVGNIPHSTSEDELKELFSKCGNVQDVRIHGKNQVRPGVGGGNARAPLYAFVAFDSIKGVEAALNEKPMLNGDHRLNVEPKRRPMGQPNRGGHSMGGNRPMGDRGGMNQGQNRGGGGRPPMGAMGTGPSREGGRGGGMSGGRGGGGGGGGYMNNRRP